MAVSSVDSPSLIPPGDRLLQCGNRLLDLSAAKVMGVLNITPDSFSDGGQLFRQGTPNLDRVLARAEQMLSEGAAILDVGGESTRPGAEPVSARQEMDRVLPVVEALARRFETVISVDTSSPELMRAAAAAGAGMINDVRALEREGAVEAAAATGLPVCLMHMQGRPPDMQDAPNYRDVVVEVADYLRQRADACMAAGIAASAIVVDPGFGFGKTVQHNLQLLRGLPQLQKLGFPVLVGLSRKSLIGKLLGCEVDQRLAGSLALAVIAAERGASIVRCHDVRETADALKLLEYVQTEDITDVSE